MPYFPLGSAFPGFPKVTNNAVVREIAAEHGVTPAQVGLAWLLTASANTLLIPGTRSITHLEENMKVADVVLSDDAIARLDAITAPGESPDYLAHLGASGEGPAS